MDGLTDKLDLASIVGVGMGQTRHQPLWSSRGQNPTVPTLPKYSSGRYSLPGRQNHHKLCCEL